MTLIESSKYLPTCFISVIGSLGPDVDLNLPNLYYKNSNVDKIESMEKAAEIESFSDGDNLEYPQYTRPEEFRGMKVPEVLLSGNHGEIAKWREAHTSQVKSAQKDIS